MTVKLCERPSEVKTECGALFTLGEVASALGAQCDPRWRDIGVERVVADSRGGCSEALFVALRGTRFDGHDYVQEAFARGAVAAIISELPAGTDTRWPLVMVENTLSALTDLAAYHRLCLSIPVIGITGSCGKSTTKEFLAAALSRCMSVAKPRASYNNVIGVSLTVLSVRPHHAVLVLELGTSAPGEIEALCEIGLPTIGIITNIGHSHLEKLGSIEGVKREKGTLLKYLGEGGVLVTNADCRECRELAESFDGRVVTVAAQSQARHRVTLLKEDGRGLTFSYDGIGATVPASGEHNALNAGLAAAAAQVLGLKAVEALEAMSRAKMPRMRMEREIVGGVWLINDAYNSNLESLTAAIETFDAAAVPGRKILVCGDMLELGNAARALHARAGARIGRSSVDILVTVGPNAELIAREADKSGTKVVFHRETVDDVAALLEEIVRRGDAVLFKASRAVQLERAVSTLHNALAGELVMATS